MDQSGLQGQTLGGFLHSFSSSICAVDYRSFGDEQDAPSRSRHVRLGSIDILEYCGPSFRSATHRGHHIASLPTDDFLLFLPLNVPFEIAQSGNEAMIAPGQLVLSTTAQPFETSNHVDPRRNYMEQRVVRIPGASLRWQIPQLERYCVMPLATDGGAGCILGNMIDSTLAYGQRLSKAQGEMFGSMLINMIGLTVLDAAARSRPFDSACDDAYARVRLNAMAFIESRLSDSQLDPRMIAERCHVSLRRLHLAFEAAATTVAETVREMRLQRARAELQDASFDRYPVFQIAARWGFGSPEHFARTYRKRFGISPSRERQVKPPAPSLR